MANIFDKAQATTVDQEDAGIYTGINRTTTPVDRWMKPGDFHKARSGNYSVLSYASLSAAVSAIGSSTQATLEVPVTSAVTSDLTVPSNITLLLSGTGDFNVSSTKTLTINGPIIAPLRQIFTGAGSVRFGNLVRIVFPQWFGAKGDGRIVTDAGITSSTLTSSTAAFTATDVGKCIDLAGSGAATELSAVITAYTSTTSVTLSLPASYTGSNKTVSLDSSTIATGSMTAGSTTLTTGSSFFTADDVGKIVRVTAVGAKNQAGKIKGVTNSST